MERRKYKTKESLNSIKSIIDKARQIISTNEVISETDTELKKILVEGVNNGIIGILGGPVVVLGIEGYKLLIKNKMEKEIFIEKKALLQEAIKKQNIIIDKLKNKVQLVEEKARELESMNMILAGIINDLKGDLEVT